MDIQEIWEKALKNTEIVRPRVQPLLTFAATHLPYIFLAESTVNLANTVVRRGEVLVEKPSIILPFNLPQFNGFDFEEELHLGDELITNFLLVRGVTFPALRYNNKTHSLDIYEDKLDKAIEHYSDKLQREEDVYSGLVVGPADSWQFSVLVFVCSQVARSSNNDIRKLLEDFKKRDNI